MPMKSTAPFIYDRHPVTNDLISDFIVRHVQADRVMQFDWNSSSRKQTINRDV